jgi:hypothetical protein
MTTTIDTKSAASTSFKWVGSGERQAIFAFKNGALLAAARVRFSEDRVPAVKANVYGFVWSFGRGGQLDRRCQKLCV